VYGKETRTSPVTFTYLETYGSGEVRRNTAVQRDSLKTGKWFYLRAPRVFLERILPKLTHKLQDFADIKRGFTAGANDFFYMKDISHLYEADYLENPKKFQQVGVETRTVEELNRAGLIYVENEGGIRVVVDKKDLAPIIRSPRELKNYSVTETTTLSLYTSSPGRMTAKYIEWGERQSVQVKDKEDTRIVRGYHRLETTKNRKLWFKLPHLKPAHILFPMAVMDRLAISYSEKPVICDNRLYAATTKSSKLDPKTLWMYLNSTIFLITIEVFCRRLGGGATDIKVEDYEIMPVPDLESLTILYEPDALLRREVMRYYEEIRQPDRKTLDIAILKSLGFDEPESILNEVHNAFLEAVDDRLIKAGRPLRRETEDNVEGSQNDQDN
jgi:hypothetical protein